jgi:hypothetical protein
MGIDEENSKEATFNLGRNTPIFVQNQNLPNSVLLGQYEIESSINSNNFTPQLRASNLQGKELTTALKESQAHPTGYKLSNLSDLIKSKEFYKLDSYFQDLFRDVYNYASRLETFTVNGGLEIKKQALMNENLLKAQKFKEQMIGRLTEENRVLNEQI